MKKIIAGILATLTLTGGGVYYAAQPPKVKVQDPLTLKWERPTTDAEWNEDVKKEYVDIRGTKVLEEMLAGQKSKLEKNQNNFERHNTVRALGLDPVQVMALDLFKQFKEAQHPVSDEELMMEARNEAERRYAQEVWEIEKNRQSIERIEKELEMRKSGFVKIKGEPSGLFGAEVPPERIREPID